MRCVLAMVMGLVLLLSPMFSSAGQERVVSERSLFVSPVDDLDRVLAFWHDRVIDRELGGYNTARLGQPEVYRLAVSQARLVWVFSQAHLRGHSTEDRDYLAAAKHGADYLLEVMRDEEAGGYAYLFSPEGEVREVGRDLYTQAFVIYGLSAYGRASGDADAIDEAESLLWWIDETLRDAEGVGWHELARADGSVVLTMEGVEDLGGIARPPYRSANAVLHLLEACSELLRARPGSEIGRETLSHAYEVLVGEFYPDDPEDCAEWVLRRGGYVPGELRLLSLGHQVEAAWLLAEADELLERAPDRAKLDRYLTHAMSFEARYVPLAARVGGEVQDADSIWWVQNEAIAGVAFGAARGWWGMERGHALVDWYQSKQVDRETGVAFASVDSEGRVIEGIGPSPWKVGYHDLRMRWMLEEARAATDGSGR
ncbi:MAG: AGE family epimerase/isomerase [Phycisphaeraceae bacterium]